MTSRTLPSSSFAQLWARRCFGSPFPLLPPARSSREPLRMSASAMVSVETTTPPPLLPCCVFLLTRPPTPLPQALPTPAAPSKTTAGRTCQTHSRYSLAVVAPSMRGAHTAAVNISAWQVGDVLGDRSTVTASTLVKTVPDPEVQGALRSLAAQFEACQRMAALVVVRWQAPHPTQFPPHHAAAKNPASSVRRLPHTQQTTPRVLFAGILIARIIAMKTWSTLLTMACHRSPSCWCSPSSPAPTGAS